MLLHSDSTTEGAQGGKAAGRATACLLLASTQTAQANWHPFLGGTRLPSFDNHAHMVAYDV